MNNEKRAQIFHRLQQHNPAPTTELNYHTPFELLVAVALSAQATDKSVNKATGPLFKKYNTAAKMLKLGVGRKTANVILNTAFGHPTIAVDTHIFRVSNRTRLAPGKTVLEVEKKLVKFVPEQYKKDAHHWLILHGRYTCIARKPRCGACVIEDLCEFKDKQEL